MVSQYNSTTKLFIILLFLNIFSQVINEEYKDVWQTFPACRMGRLQSPIKLNITDSVYNSTYAIVYQNYRSFTGADYFPLALKGPVVQTIKDLADETSAVGGFINFQKGGVIKQYELLRFELYQKAHQVYSETSTYELHIVHRKVLGFSTSQNRYRTIQDANNYLVIVLRYSSTGKASDDGLLDAVTKATTPFDLSKYPVFQDKSSFYYEGAFMFNPCDEDVNYIVIEPLYKLSDTVNTAITTMYLNKEKYGIKDLAYAYERPIYRNFMNYTESLISNQLASSICSIILFFSLII